MSNKLQNPGYYLNQKEDFEMFIKLRSLGSSVINIVINPTKGCIDQMRNKLIIVKI